ncbi:MAG: hypothetical protein ABIJ05_01985, partial [Patescibacteria group bacterium]
MANPEHKTGNESDKIIEVVALFLLGKVKMEDMNENNQFVLKFHLSLMSDDPEFKAAVDKRKNKLMVTSIKEERIPLYSKDQLKNAKPHRKRKKHYEKISQPRLFEEVSIVEKNSSYGYENVIDPERKLVRLHKEFNNIPYGNNKNSLINEEIKHNRKKLRNEIGLPIVRGKDPHVGDYFYKFLVKRIVEFDVFGIFSEYNGIENNPPTDLETRISQVKRMVSEGLASSNQNEGFK